MFRSSSRYRWTLWMALAGFLLFSNVTNVPRARGSLEASIGRMIMVGFRGVEVDADSPVVRQIQEGHVGGVILFDHDVPSGSDMRNVRSASQLKRLLAQLQSYSNRRLLIGIDQEGGTIQRLGPEYGFQAHPSHQQLGNENDLERTFRVASQLAQTLHRLGFNVNFAPVVDLNLNPENPVIGALERSFGADPQLVTRHARSFIRAHWKWGVQPVIKHFPGHGSARRDSHQGVVDVTEVWKRKELDPYRHLLASDPVPAVMTAHLFHRQWDRDWPATLSARVIDGMLRRRLEYDGVVFTDDLQMGAIRTHYSRRTVLKRAIRAGVDVLVFANNSVYEPRVASKTVRAVMDLIEAGEISVEAVQRSNRRIETMIEELPEGP